MLGVRSGAGLVVGLLGGWHVLAEVEPIRRPIAPGSGNAVPPPVVALPVAVDPEPARRRHAPGPGDPDEVLAARVPVPVPRDPGGVGTRRIDRGPLHDRRRGGLVDRGRVLILGR